MSAVVSAGGRKNLTEAGIYMEVGNKHLRIYGGVYQPDKDQLNAIRQEILYNMEDFKKLISDKNFVKYFSEIRGEQNKRLPKEYAEIQEQQPLIANKQFYYYCDLDPALIQSDKLIDELFKAYEASRGVREFLHAPLND